MKINLRVTYSGATPKEVTCSAKDLVAFEERFDRSVARLQDEFKITDLLYLAWHSEKRTNATKKEFDSWLDDVDSVEVSDQDPK
jgi:hypothetical protein